jgi:hypothetical protein
MNELIYPDVSGILARKKAARREISRRSFGEKIAMVEALRDASGAPQANSPGASCANTKRN